MELRVEIVSRCNTSDQRPRMQLAKPLNQSNMSRKQPIKAASRTSFRFVPWVVCQRAFNSITVAENNAEENGRRKTIE